MKESGRAGSDATLRRPATATVDGTSGRNRLRHVPRGRESCESMYAEKWFERKDRGFGTDMKAHLHKVVRCVYGHACMHACMYVCMYVCMSVWFERGDKRLRRAMKHYLTGQLCAHVCLRVYVCIINDGYPPHTQSSTKIKTIHASHFDYTPVWSKLYHYDLGQGFCFSPGRVSFVPSLQETLTDRGCPDCPAGTARPGAQLGHSVLLWENVDRKHGHTFIYTSHPCTPQNNFTCACVCMCVHTHTDIHAQPGDKQKVAHMYIHT
jgi:hypothetical protein